MTMTKQRSVAVVSLHGDLDAVHGLRERGFSSEAASVAEATALQAADALVIVAVPDARAHGRDADPESAWRGVVDAGLALAHGAVLTWCAAPAGREAGAVVFVVEAAALVGETAPAEAALAGALVSMSKALARELGPNGVVVNCVAAAADDPQGLAETLGYLVAGDHYFAGTVLSPAAGVIA